MEKVQVAFAGQLFFLEESRQPPECGEDGLHLTFFTLRSSHFIQYKKQSTEMVTQGFAQDETWDDSDLVRSWNDALDEYKVRCSFITALNHVLTILQEIS